MTVYAPDFLADLATGFRIDGTVAETRLISNGHIHDTWEAIIRSPTGGRSSVILQHINKHVFPRPLEVMDNVRRVTAHLRAKLAATPGDDPARGTLTIVPTVDGRDCVQRVDGEFWRCYETIERATTYDVAQNHHMAYEAARAFGRFQRLLLDLPGAPLFETIYKFHHTPTRYAALRQAIAADSCNRAAGCAAEIEFALAHEYLVDIFAGPLERGELPTRHCHNDTKINNVMFDDASGLGLCVIDLDTVMPGTVLYDFGDQVRTTTGHFDESTRDLSQVVMDIDRFDALVRGYFEEAGAFLTPAEIAGIAVAGPLITFQIGIRFLTDYLAGDTYFRCHYPGQNLDRTRVQFAFVQSMEAQRAAMDEIVARYR